VGPSLILVVVFLLLIVLFLFVMLILVLLWLVMRVISSFLMTCWRGMWPRMERLLGGVFELCVCVCVCD